MHKLNLKRFFEKEIIEEEIIIRLYLYYFIFIFYFIYTNNF